MTCYLYSTDLSRCTELPKIISMSCGSVRAIITLVPKCTLITEPYISCCLRATRNKLSGDNPKLINAWPIIGTLGGSKREDKKLIPINVG